MAFITVYSLIVPAVAFDRGTAAKTAGTDAGSGYQLACTQEVHKHTEGCYETQPVYDADGKQTGTEKVLICGKEDYVVHEHDENCYETVAKTITENGKQKTVEEKVLVCTLPEIKEHKHTKDCYTEEKVLTCGKTEQEAHKHSDKCYKEKKTLDCGKEEHKHSNKCYAEVVVSSEKVLQCGYKDGQEISPAVYSDPVVNDETGEVIEEAQLIQEAVVHHHDDSCYQTVEKTEKQLTCGLGEHTHSDKCYRTAKELVCGKEETKGHKHSKSCYGKEKVLTCGKLELHTHTIDCYEKGPKNESPEKMGWVHYEKDADGNKVLVGDPKHLTCGKTELLAHQHDADCWVTEEEAAEIAEAKAADEAAGAEENTEAAKEEGAAEEADNWYQLNKEDTPQAETPDKGGKTGAADKDVASETPDKNTGSESADKDAVIETADENAGTETVDENTESESADTATEITVPVSGASYELHISYDADSNIPEDAKFVAEAITENDQAYDTYREKAVEAVDEKLDNETKAAQDLLGLFDLTIYDAGENPVQPEAPINVTVDFGNEIDESNKEVYAVHFQEDAADGEMPADETAVEVIDTDYAGETAESVSFAAESLPVYAIVGTETLTTKVITAKGETYTIDVTYGPEAEIPKDAVLEATEVKEDSEEYKEYSEKALAAITEDKDTALVSARFFDISIISNGEKIEPKASVDVKISYDNPISTEIGSEIKQVHFASTGTEVLEVETGKNTEGEIMEVRFAQDSFSITGTVVTTGSNGWPTDTGYYAMIVKAADESKYYAVGKSGDLTEVTYDASTGKVTFLDISDSDNLIDYEWEYLAASYFGNTYRALSNGNTYIDPTNVNSGISNTPTYLSINNGHITATSGGLFNPTTYYLTANGGTLKVGGSSNSSNKKIASVFFANKFDAGGNGGGGTPSGGDDVDLGAPAISKTLEPIGDGTYNLILSVTGKSKAQKERTKADVTIIFDRSGSMRENSTSGRRDKVAIAATKGLVTELLKNNTTAYPDTVNISIVQFNNGASTVIANNRNQNTLHNSIDGLTGQNDTGTNWEAALKQAASTPTATGREKAKKYVIFVSDGNPTFYSTDAGNGDYAGHVGDYDVYGSGQEIATNIRRSYDAAKDDARSLVLGGAEFYTLGVFGSVDRMSNLTAFAYSGNDIGTYPEGHYQTATDTASLNNAFAKIINDINKNFSYTDVTIDDGITDLTATALVNGDVNSFTYERSGGSYGEGQAWTPDETQQADYVNGRVDWSLGKNFKLEDGVTYTVKFRVWPSQEAYDLVADLNNGVKQYSDLTDDEKYQIQGSEGNYSLKTNTDDSKVTYRQITTTDGVDSDPSEVKEVKFVNPPSVPLGGNKMQVEKVWNDGLDTTHRPAEGGVTKPVTFEVWYGPDADHLTQYKNADGTPYTIVLSDANEWHDEVAIAPGIIDGEGKTLDEGHFYTLKEIDLEADYYYEFSSEVIHPMIVNNVMTLVGDDNKNSVLTAVNHLRGGINIQKIVKASDEVTTIYPDQAFTLKASLKDKNGNPYLFENYLDEETGKVDGDTYPIWYVLFDGTDPDMQPSSGAQYGMLQDGDTIEIKPTQILRFINVPIGTQYSFTEPEATIPEGYELNGIVDDNNGRVKANTSHHVTVTNIQKAVAVAIEKKSSTDGTPLDGVKFELYSEYEDDSKVKAKHPDGTEVGTLTTTNGGKATIGQLAIGTYYLVETNTVAGYNLLTDPVEIYVAADGVTYYQKDRQSSITENPKGVVVDGVVTFTITVTNSPGVELPMTGGSGTLPYTLCGLVLIMAAAMMYCVKMRRKGGDSLS